jgi:hypothetical protein
VLRQLDARTWAAWPTKLAAAPLLADRVLALDLPKGGRIAAGGEFPGYAAPPWEAATWC